MKSLPLITIIGPTACGKTSRGVDIAKRLNGEIISADSRQVYRGMDIGTGKDLDEYDGVPYHLIDIVPAGYKYNLYEYVRDARKALADISGRNRQPILVGGTGLYVETLLKGLALPEVPRNNELRDELAHKSLDELAQILAGMKQLHNVTDLDSRQRAIRAIEIATFYSLHPELAPVAGNSTPIPSVIIHIEIDRETRRQRIDRRLAQRLESGMVDEVKKLLESGVTPEQLTYYGLEYKFLTEYVTGHLSYSQMVNELNIAIHQFAKRQETWFRGMERRGFKLHHLPYNMDKEEFVSRVLEIADRY